MRYGLSVIGCAVLCFVAACGSGATPSAGGGGNGMPTTVPSNSAGAPLTTVKGDSYASEVLNVGELPAGYQPDKGSTAQSALSEQQSILKSRTVTPPQCGAVSPITDESAKTGLFTAFTMAATQETIGEFLAPAGSPTLRDLQSTAATCASVTATDPAKGLKLTGGVAIVEAPQVSADRTLGLRTTAIATAAGSRPVTTITISYLAESKGTLISINAKGGPSGNPVDPAIIADEFTQAVQKVNNSS